MIKVMEKEREKSNIIGSDYNARTGNEGRKIDYDGWENRASDDEIIRTKNEENR